MKVLSLLKRTLVFVAALTVVAVLGFWALQARDSELFRVQKIELSGLENTGLKKLPVSRETILAMLDIQRGDTGLFRISLNDLEEKFATLGWIRRIDFRKRFPDTFAVHVEFRQPLALIQAQSGELSYIDDTGFRFGPVDSQIAFDLPVISIATGGAADLMTSEQFRSIVDIVKAAAEKSAGFEVSSLEIDAKSNLRVMITYPLIPTSGRQNPHAVPASRTLIPWSQDFDAKKVIPRISKVIQYLREHSMAAKSLILGDGKKIIVKTARGS